MANAVSSQVLIDGPRNYVLKWDVVLDTSDLAITDIIDPATFLGGAASTVAIERLEWIVEDGLAVYLWWDATADVIIGRFTGRGEIKPARYGALNNNAGAGKTGKVQVSTQGWAASAVLSATLIIHCEKQ